MYYLYLATGVALLLSFCVDRKKSLKALKISYKKFINILPSFLMMLILISIVLYFIPDKTIMNYLGNSNNKIISVSLGLLFGAITLMPGFIAFPLCGILLKKGVSYMVLSALSTSLMMVGVLTYPVEKAYFGVKVTIIRNLISLLIAILTALAIGFFFGEL
jgi:uncharacterized membrane protein YraQ (UPF0718 family)